ncbi:hypothetical protein EX895_005580 [Sporisorium graminicola]|uniref:Uncharacterized protein n=1 Tax=Sporisorium graminicola TaxID=280036 RepID=A0A4U7KQG1_9BASI|nr:hypothetical protein EX895_005580 [Sporisorium graminicola]TKY85418.1 hypothetical protein EX895_005580 [Sporisorium graminicola]
MLVYMSQYVEDRSTAPSPVPVVSSSKPVHSNSKSKKDKINFVSKASLAIFDPRHAMGIDTGLDWYDSGCNTHDSRSSFEHPSQRSAGRSQENVRNQQWSTSPTPELEAFTDSMGDYSYDSASSVANTEMTRQASASSSVFEDDRDIPEVSSRRRFLSRKSVAPVKTPVPTDDILFSPLATKSKSTRSTGAGASAASSLSNTSSFSRLFTRKKKDKAAYPIGFASRSTPDLFDDLPQSAPPTTLTFEQSGFRFSPQRKDSDSSSLYASPPSLPTSPERRPFRMGPDISPTRTSTLSAKQSMPALRQIREAHSGVSAAQSRSISFVSPEKRQRPRQSVATARSESFDVAPALPPLPSFETSSPMIPLEFAWDSKRGTARQSQMPTLGSNNRPVSRVVSSTSRGVPSPGLNPIRLNDLRKSTMTLRNEPALRYADDTRLAPSKSTVTRPAASPRRNADKRMSMTQRVVDGLLDQNHGREEPEMRSRRSDMEVKSARRRSRSVEARALPSVKHNNLVSPPSSNSHSDSVFPAFVRHAPVPRGRASSPQPRFFADADVANAVTPTPAHAKSLSTPTSAPPSSSPGGITVRKQSPSIRNPQHQASGETHQARRVNFAGQRAKAVAVASPLLLSRSPLLGGRSGTPLPVVNIMPPTPDLGASGQDQERQCAAAKETVEQEPMVAAAAGSAKVAKGFSATPSSTKAHAAPSRQGAATTTPNPVAERTSAETAVAAPAKRVQTAPIVVMSPESVCSPASIYSPEATDGVFSSLLGGLSTDNEALSKEEMQVTTDSVAAELSYVGMPRTDSVTSELSEASSARSSSSGAFAFSRSMSNSSFVSGGTFSSASSNASESPERKMPHMGSTTSFDFSPTKMSSSASVASTAGTSVFGVEADVRSVEKTEQGSDAPELLDLGKLKMPFELKALNFEPASSAAADSSDCETPTLASCRQMGVNVAPCGTMHQDKASTNRQLGLSMDLSDLAQELGLGRLSQIGLAHLKGVDSLADKPETAIVGTVNAAASVKKISPTKPPKSSARAAVSTGHASNAAAGAGAGAGAGLTRFGMGMGDIASSAAMSPLPVSIAGRSPQTPPRTKAPLVEPKAGRKVSASGVPKADGGFGLGLNFVESPSPQSQLRKAAIAPGSYGQHVVEQTNTLPSQYQTKQQQQQQPYYQQQQPYAYEQQEEEGQWVGVAM